MQFIPILQILILLAVANGAPVIAKRLLGSTFSQPLDFHIRFADGRPLFGPSKTIRGVLFSIAATTIFTPLIGIEWWIGTLIAATAMAGDLFSSFLKRRMNFPQSSMVLGLDQVPESLFPALACRTVLSLAAIDIIAIVVVFFAGELVLSRILYALHIRDRPY